MRVGIDAATGAKQFLVEQHPMKIFDVEAFLGAVVGYGQKEVGRDLCSFDRYHYYATDWQDMGKRVQFLDEEGMEKQVIYPTLGLFWEGEVEDPSLADAPAGRTTRGFLSCARAIRIVCIRQRISRCAIPSWRCGRWSEWQSREDGRFSWQPLPFRAKALASQILIRSGPLPKILTLVLVFIWWGMRITPAASGTVTETPGLCTSQ
jgi:hypothetical protein